MDIFRIENSLTDLDQKVEQKRQVVGEGNRELASLEARLKKMEDRLRKTQGGNPSGHSTISLPHRPPTRDAKGMPAPQDGKIRSRPGTASANQAAPGSGNMPPTPSASEGWFTIMPGIQEIQLANTLSMQMATMSNCRPIR